MIAEPIEEVLELTGVEISLLRSPVIKFKIFPGFDFDFLSSGRGSTANIERQSFSFQGSSETIAPLNLQRGEVFSIGDTINIYEFKINTNPIPDITGWHRIFADFITISAIIIAPNNLELTNV